MDFGDEAMCGLNTFPDCVSHRVSSSSLVVSIEEDVLSNTSVKKFI